MSGDMTWQEIAADLTRRVEALERRQEWPWPDKLWGKPVGTPDPAPVHGCAYGCDDPAPVPEWRRLVDEGERVWYDIEPDLALRKTLEALAQLAGECSHMVTIHALARIVAVCEAQVGDGWQADPDLIRMCHKDGRARCDVECLIDALTRDEEARWIVLAGRAASWLRDLTQEQS